MTDDKIRHYKCPKCGRTTSASGLIPKCKCSGKTEQTKTLMEVIKK